MVFPNHPLPPSPETQSSGHEPLTPSTRSSPQTVKSRRYRSRRRGYEVALGTLGAIGGGGLGWATAGVEGLVIGIVLGAVAAALAAWAAQGQEREIADRNSQLDAEIGVDGGDIGAPNLEHPPSRSPHPSRESSGVGGVAGSSPASGPFLKPPS